MNMLQYKNKKILIMGLGTNGGGIGAAEFFARAGAFVTVTDLKTKKGLVSSLKLLKKYKNIRYVLGGHRKSDFQRADLIIKNPDVRNASPYLAVAKKHGVPIETDVSIFFRLCKNPIIGITGTKGKSTTTHLIRSILQTTYPVHVGGNIGVSVLSILPKLKPDDYVVLELSSWQLEGMAQAKKSPRIAVITNIQHDHLNTYKNFKEYAKTKELIFKYQKKDEWLLAHHRLSSLKKNAPGNVQTFQYSKPLEKKLRHAGFSLFGTHAVENAAAALAVANIMNISEQTALKALARVRPLFGRYEIVPTKDGVHWVNDTCSTAPYSTIQSIEATPKAPILITGGTDKNLPYDALAKTINRRIQKLILLAGSATEKLKKNLTVPFFETRRLSDAIHHAAALAKRGDWVLFSPGAASFELFKNEFDRGRKFAACVARLQIDKQHKKCRSIS